VKCKLERALRRYCRAVGRRLYCSGGIKKEFMRDFRERIDRFQAEHAVSDLREIHAAFGTPREAARRFLAKLPPAHVKRARIAIWVKRIVLYGALLVFLVYFTDQLYHLLRDINGYYEITLSSEMIYFEDTMPISP